MGHLAVDFLWDLASVGVIILWALFNSVGFRKHLDLWWIILLAMSRNCSLLFLLSLCTYKMAVMFGSCTDSLISFGLKVLSYN